MVGMAQSRLWPVMGIVTIGGIIFLMAATIVLALIPIYIKSSTVPVDTTTTSFTYEKNLTLNSSIYPSALTTLQSTDLKSMEGQFQQLFDADKDGAGTQVTLEESGFEPLSVTKKRDTDGVQGKALITGRMWVKGKLSRRRLVVTALALRFILQRVFDNNFLIVVPSVYIRIALNTTTTRTTTTTTPIPLPVVFTVTPGATVSPMPGKRRRRRSFHLPLPTPNSAPQNHMPIAGALLISLKQPNNTIQRLRKQNIFFNFLPLNIQHLPAIDGDHIDLYTFIQEDKITQETYDEIIRQDQHITGHNLSLGSLGCLESHVHAWQRVVELNQPMLILEDDIQFDKDLFDTMMPYLLYSLPTNFSLLYFGNLIGKDFEPELRHYNDLLWKVNASYWGTYAYLISPQAAAVLLDSIYPAYAQVDSMIRDIAVTHSFDVYMSKQLLVRTENTQRRSSKTQRYLIEPLMIPRVFHFIWLNGDELPASAQKNMDRWHELHPKWQIRLWTNESVYNSNSDVTWYNRDLFIRSNRSLRQASDILRYDIVYQLGGVYLDLDFEPLKNIEALLHGVEAFVVHENEMFVCNGVFGMTPGHELGRRLVMELESSMKAHVNETVNQQTGPYHMTRQVNEMVEDHVMKFAPHVFFPYAWFEKDHGHSYDSSAYAVHHFRPVEEILRDAREGL